MVDGWELTGRTVDIPLELKAKSVKITGPSCCILYRAQCPTKKVGDWPHVPLFLNQRIFSDVPDLEPLGFSNIVRSIVCPKQQDVCRGLQVDEDHFGEEQWSMKGYWLDMRYLPAHGEQ
ncbi:hypothetical protein B0T16DRAFT_409038 [Cercophora newfieldiana]|uniref:Uncharacterized protein n=1 Tax=Cercophora newfieldiana TaxID=92897 RepID=A0AA40CSC7_9PEZI|nr:hypothetical protein B0T16DRAFT_409038 [Cercophora newfieldiana]